MAGEQGLESMAAAARDGDAAAARALVGAVGGSLLGVIRSVLGATHPDVEDVLQEALLGLFDALASFRGECGLKHYACRIAARTALDARRRGARARRRTEALEIETRAQGTPAAPADRADACRRLELVRALLDELPAEQAETFALRILCEWSLEEVAGATGAPVNTVRSRMRLAKEALARRLDHDRVLLEELEVAG
jgi:RNA polymerase sigma-70 factor (ECF subfamily)